MATPSSDLDAIFAVLADPTRRGIVENLGRGLANVPQLAAGTRMALPSFLRHLQKLQAAGLVVSKKAGRVRTCRLAPGALAPARYWLGEQRLIWNERLDQFDECVRKLNKERSNDADPQSGD